MYALINRRNKYRRGQQQLTIGNLPRYQFSIHRSMDIGEYDIFYRGMRYVASKIIDANNFKIIPYRQNNYLQLLAKPFGFSTYIPINDGYYQHYGKYLIQLWHWSVLWDLTPAGHYYVQSIPIFTIIRFGGRYHVHHSIIDEPPLALLHDLTILTILNIRGPCTMHGASPWLTALA